MQKILLITKNYPPQIGGIEKYSSDLYIRLVKEGNEVMLIAAGPRSEWLLQKKGSSNVFLKALFTLFYILSEIFRLGVFAVKCFTYGGVLAHKTDIIWSLDGSIAPIGVILGKVFHKKKRVTLHGTDVTWHNPIYQAVMPFFWRQMDEVYVVSQFLYDESVKRQVPKNILQIHKHDIKNSTCADTGKFNKNTFLESHNLPSDKVLLFSLGRFIELKGFHWFLEEVVPFLDAKFHYILGGFGPMDDKYKKIIKERHLNNVSIIGAVRDPIEKARFYTVSDFFIMPNLKPEGFGLVLLEAENYKLRRIIADVFIDTIRKNPHDAFIPTGEPSLWIEFLNCKI